MSPRLVMYMSPWCINCLDTQEALDEWHVNYVNIDIKKDKNAASRVRAWTGFESVPTLILADDGSLEPNAKPDPLAPGISPRGVDRGTMLTEPTRKQLRAWLIKNGIVAEY
ncbi:MAG TPA: glutaredoxin family protein [Anaerolineae bacterium]